MMPLEEHADLEIAVSRLLEDESLTEDLDDPPAQVLLDWGVAQLKAGREGSEVRRIVRRLARIVRDRHRLTLQEALQRLEVPAENESVLAALWEEREGLAEAEWAGRLTAVAGRKPGLMAKKKAQEGEEAQQGEERTPRRAWWQFWRRWA